MSSVPHIPRATLADWEAFDEDARPELIDGRVSAAPPPSFDHGLAQSQLAYELTGPFQRGRGGPGGWVFVTEVDLLLPGGDAVRPDLCGWRRDRAPQRPVARPCGILPDLVVEILSPSDPYRDRVQKSHLYAVAGVPWYWIVDPVARTVEVFENQGGRWLVAAGFDEAASEARIPPLDGAPLDVGAFFRA